MAIRQLDPHKLHSKREVESYYDGHPDVVSSRQAGTSHKVYKGKRGSFVVPTGHGEMSRGTLKSILTQAAAAGVVILVIVLALA
jgi:hypothetical protein